jgi:hypothetical protein
MSRLLSWDRAEPLGESGGSSVGKGGEGDMESWHLPGCSPYLCRLRTKGLVPVSKYWTYWSYAIDMGLVNWCSLLPPDAWLSPLLQWLWGAEKLDGDPQIGQLAWWGCSREFLFLSSSDFVQRCWWLMKGCHIRGLLIGSARVPYVDKRWKHTCSVYEVSPAGCT